MSKLSHSSFVDGKDVTYLNNPIVNENVTSIQHTSKETPEHGRPIMIMCNEYYDAKIVGTDQVIKANRFVPYIINRVSSWKKLTDERNIDCWTYYNDLQSTVNVIRK